MEPTFNIDRPKVSDEEINKRKNFEKLVNEFKQRSLKQAQGDESWRKNKTIRYTTVILGVTIICTVSIYALFKSQQQKTKKHETLITSATSNTKPAAASAKRSIQEPSAKLKIPYTAYKVNSAKGASLQHAGSSTISIPANSFVNKAGEDIVGDVTIEYREFHDAADIIASGIPMAYDSANAHFNLESAGMFDIRGTQNGEPVYIKPGKPLEVKLASRNSENRFNQYYLDTAAGNWSYMKRDEANALPAAHAPQQAARVKSPENIVQASPKLVELKNQVEVVLPKRVDSVKVVYTRKVDQLTRAREPQKPARPTAGRPSFKLDGSYNEFPELAAFNNVTFEVGPENNNYSSDMHSITWSDVKVSQGPVKGKNYLLTLSYRSRVEKLVVYPVLTGADFDKAENAYEQKLADYDRLVEKRRADEKKLLDEMQAKQQAYLDQLKKRQDEYDKEKAKLFAKYNMEQNNDLVNSFATLSNSVRAMRLFSISQFGIFNSDCPHSEPQGDAIHPVFVLNEGGQPLAPDFIYLVDHSTRMVYSLNQQNGFSMRCKAGNGYSICVFNKNRLYMCNKSSFGKSMAANSNKFVISPMADGADNLVDFKKALEI